MITARLKNGMEVNIRHVLIEKSSQWVIGRKVASKCDIVHTKGNYLQLLNQTRIALEDFGHHSYVPYLIFVNDKGTKCSSFQAKLFCATGNISGQEAERPWSETKKVIDKVHKDVCGHASLSDMEILVKRNDL